ncbi:MAG: hypothetical protein ACHP7N_18460 [Caulobacterales bacterium]
MTRHTTPFGIEAPLSPRLDRLLSYWRGLLRGEATIPFADDIDMAAAKGLCGETFLLGVFAKPERFRLELATTPSAPQVEADLVGRFIDEVDLPTPLEFLRAQADSTVESQAPTLYEHRPTGGEKSYGRLLLPGWGEGQVKMLLGAVEWR